jgi:hypothetical protein
MSKVLAAITILLLSVVVTIGSYPIVTRRNVPMNEKAVAVGYTSLTGKYLVTLPCARPDYNSAKPTLPEARGIPFNYNYYNPCDGHQIIREGFLLDVGFWTIIFSSLYIFYTKGQKVAKRVHWNSLRF